MIHAEGCGADLVLRPSKSSSVFKTKMIPEAPPLHVVFQTLVLTMQDSKDTEESS